MYTYMTLRATKTTGFDPDVYAAVVRICDSEKASWNDAVNELIRRGLESLET